MYRNTDERDSKETAVDTKKILQKLIQNIRFSVQICNSERGKKTHCDVQISSYTKLGFLKTNIFCVDLYF